MEKLREKVAVVTGGGSGIGRAIAQRFAQEGAHVVIAGRKEQPLQETAAADEKIAYVVGDVTRTETIENIINTIKEMFGRLDILVNNAGWCPVQPITEIRAAMTIPNWTYLSLFLKSISLLMCITCRPYAYNYTLTQHKTLHLKKSK